MAMTDAFLYEIFLDLHKVYDALERDMCLVIIAAYGVGPRELRLLQKYWGWITMVARDGEYYEPPLPGIPWCDPRRPPPPHFLQRGSGHRHLTLVDGGIGNKGGRVGTWYVDTGPCGIFYGDDRIVASTQPERLQRVFDVLIELFGRVGPWTNTQKTAIMACHP